MTTIRDSGARFVFNTETMSVQRVVLLQFTFSLIELITTGVAIVFSLVNKEIRHSLNPQKLLMLVD